MNLITVELLKKLGFKAIYVDNRYMIIDPSGRVVSQPYAFKEEEAWRSLRWGKYVMPGQIDIFEHLPQLANYYNELWFDWTRDEDITIIDEDNQKAIDEHVHKYGSDFPYRIVLTPEDLKALKEGKCIVWGQGDCASIIYYHDEKEEEITISSLTTV